MILSQAPPHVIKHAERSYEDSLKQILTRLQGVASSEGYGKYPVLMFSDIGDYYGYIAYFYPEGESPMTGGLCLTGDGCLHFAFPTIDFASYHTILVHELTHGCLQHLPIPSWVHEAIAMRMEQVICGSDIFHLDRELYHRHSTHWNGEAIQQFWTGESWQIPGKSFELSYNLAQILWRGSLEADS